MRQYIDFYNSQRDNISAHSSQLMNSHRAEALEVVERVPLPRKGSENYEVSDLPAMFAPDFGINVNRVDIPIDVADTFRCDVPNLSTHIYFLLNDAFLAGKSSGVSMPSGVIVDSLCRASQLYPDLVGQYYNTIAPHDNAQVALNTLLAQDGVFVYIPDGVVLDKPLQFVNIFNSAKPLMGNRRWLIVMGSDSNARMLLCDHTQNKECEFLNNQVMEVVLGENATLDIYDIEESSSLTGRVSSLWARQATGSNLLVNGITLVNGTTRNDMSVDIVGEHCETHLLGMAICNEHQVIDNHTFIAHNTPRCTSNELFKYVLDNEARGAFTGKILVKKGADKVEAYQSNKNVLASELAKVHTKPQLEIYNDDVRCSHGATVGQLDKNALFYMQARGISLTEARTLLMQAFMSDVIAEVRLESLRDRLRHLVEKRFYGQLALCRDCAASCHDKINHI